MKQNQSNRVRKTSLAAAVFCTLLSIQSTVQAENSPSDRDFDNRFYIGAGIGATYLQPESDCNCYEVGDETDVGGQLFLGYDISKRWSVEAYAADLGKAGVDLNGQHAGDISYRHFGVSAIGYFYNNRNANDYVNGWDDEGYYRREGVSLYGRIGAGAMENESDDLEYTRENDAHLHLGVGAEYGWRNGVAARAEVTSYDTDAKLLSVNVLKRFGDPTPYVVKKPEPVVVAPPAPTPTPAPVIESPPAPLQLPVVNFEFDRSSLTGTARNKLDGLVDTLKPRPGTRLEVRGHTDSRGSDSYNDALSERRAQRVKKYLEQKGIEGDRLEVQGYGERQPISDNSTEEGRATNRRVDFGVK